MRGVHAFKRVLASTSQDPLTRKRQICHKRCQRASSKGSESSVGVSIMLRCYTAQPGFGCLCIYFCFLSSYASHRRLASVPARAHRALSGLVRARLRLSGDSPSISPCTRGGQGIGAHHRVRLSRIMKLIVVCGASFMYAGPNLCRKRRAPSWHKTGCEMFGLVGRARAAARGGRGAATVRDGAARTLSTAREAPLS